ncbi:type 1 glutamine amidotransferase [Flavilitoribacter nigricans]|uniref:Amidotransferase n=1 Tax=Flavilitoribacter nigricans (strain ATCC 23147 / DSM 23189 / NBRC 102662 / NCIMB 1420 / SS-2) TaxID=1122177 RepID=A0A2D0N5K3_FLAN2|nr:type 1 glutamine amidotransferase [Flavilitoribacter nigricans]PHN03439.1 amidotransferase [Flavilitoribacter nigricans DSM 23189 = NBRC 102662]
MKLGLLQCDHVADHLLALNGDYDEQFTKLLPDFEWSYYDLTAGQFPATLDECNAYLCTGSKYSVYDNISWIHQLKHIVREIYYEQIPFVGVCFGHQMIAHALGGRVDKGACGWCVGIHTFNVLQREEWMVPFQPAFNILMSCQDQVLELPQDSTVLAETADCRVGMFLVGERMLGVQGHPEFSVAYAQSLMKGRRERIGEDKVLVGLESLCYRLEIVIIREWMIKFLKG